MFSRLKTVQMRWKEPNITRKSLRRASRCSHFEKYDTNADQKLQTNFPANQTISRTHLSNLIDIDILLDLPLFAYPRLVMRAFNSFCGLRRFAALNPHLARNTIALSEEAAQSVIEIAVKEPLYSQIGPKSLGFQYLSLQGNQKRFYQLHLIKATVNMCEVGIKHVLSPGAPKRAF